MKVRALQKVWNIAERLTVRVNGVPAHIFDIDLAGRVSRKNNHAFMAKYMPDRGRAGSDRDSFADEKTAGQPKSRFLASGQIECIRNDGKREAAFCGLLHRSKRSV